MLTAEAADSVILGLGVSGYAVALEAANPDGARERELDQ